MGVALLVRLGLAGGDSRSSVPILGCFGSGACVSDMSVKKP